MVYMWDRTEEDCKGYEDDTDTRTTMNHSEQLSVLAANTKILTFSIGLKPDPGSHNVMIMIGSTIIQLMKNHENLNSHEFHNQQMPILRWHKCWNYPEKILSSF